MADRITVYCVSGGVGCTLTVKNFASYSLDTYYDAFGGYVRSTDVSQHSPAILALTDASNTLTASVPSDSRFLGWFTAPANVYAAPAVSGASSLLSSSISITKAEIEASAKVDTRSGYYICYPKFVKTVTCTYDGRGGTPSRSSDVLDVGGVFPALPTAVRGADIFDGWWTNASGGSQIKAGDAVTQTANFSLYAHWRKELICIYDPDGGSCDRYSDIVVEGGRFPELPTARLEGSETSRWYTAQTGGTEVHQGDTVTQTEDFTLYAHWNKTGTYTVTFNAGGGTSSEAQRMVNKGAAIGMLPTANWAGHTFNGWFLSPAGETAITAEYVVNDDMYLYAKWSGRPYTVTFNGNGGTPSRDTMPVTYGNQYGTLPTCYQAHKTFLGWFTAATGGTKIEPTTIFQQQSNQTLYAHWSNDDPAVKWYYLVSPT